MPITDDEVLSLSCRAAMPVQKALSIVAENGGKAFDLQCFDVLRRALISKQRHDNRQARDDSAS